MDHQRGVQHRVDDVPGRHRVAGGGHHRRSLESDGGGRCRTRALAGDEPVRGIAGRPLQPHPALFLATVVGQMVVAVALAWVVQIDAETFWVLVAFSFGGGATASVGAPVQQAIVVELVPSGAMRNAIFLNSTQWNISRAVGPMLGGWLIQFWGAASAFWFNAASFTVLVIGLSLLAAPTTARGIVGAELPGRLCVGIPLRPQHRGHPSGDAGQLHAGCCYLPDAMARPGDRRRRLRRGCRRASEYCWAHSALDRLWARCCCSSSTRGTPYSRLVHHRHVVLWPLFTMVLAVVPTFAH